jgi:cyclic pyranopterin phosphate synthase
VQDFNFIRHQEILSYEEILRLVRLAAKLGINRFRITGGEPLVRKNVETLVEEINHLPGVRDLSLTTNGIMLNEHLEKLKAAGLRRLNISLDTLDRGKYQRITGVDGLDRVLNGIRQAVDIGFNPVKINVVLLKGFNDEVQDFIRLTFDLPVHVRFIELMDFSPVEGYFVSASEIMEKIKKSHKLEQFHVAGSGPARNHYRIAGMKGSLGFIAPYSNHFCGSCNRLRVSADGQLRTCLFSEKVYDLKQLLRQRCEDEEILKFLQRALAEKPLSWHESEGKKRKNGLRSIGG